MSYFGFLAIFLIIPIVILLALQVWRRDKLPSAVQTYSPLVIIALHVVLALIYTTPWDNYLVATRVWWYDPALVTGITIGWVPIEEYTFFVLQPIMTGLFLLLLMQRSSWLRQHDGDGNPNPRLRSWVVGVTGVVWLGSVVLLLSRWGPGTYLSLELSWALIPIMLQLWFGADILWRYRRIVLPAILIPTLFLASADAIAIGSGTWTINPEQSLEWLIGGILPIEELIFFMLTNILVVFGMTLALAKDSQPRLTYLKTRFGRKSSKHKPDGIVNSEI
ncbi:MAG: lycopene cyclase domain-containing protein [Anaerolineae bacterium]|nr:lycopene cyclase domain-containing protein [Anaerolineae bacterium]